MKPFFYWGIATITSTLACSSGEFSSSQKEKTSEDQKNPDESALTPPTSVAGAFLTCYKQDLENRLLVGCFVGDKDGNKISWDRKNVEKLTLSGSDYSEVHKPNGLHWHNLTHYLDFSFLTIQGINNPKVTLKMSNHETLVSELRNSNEHDLVKDLVVFYESFQTTPENGLTFTPNTNKWKSVAFLGIEYKEPCEGQAEFEVQKNHSDDVNQWLETVAICDNPDQAANLEIKSKMIKIGKGTKYDLSLRYSSGDFRNSNQDKIEPKVTLRFSTNPTEYEINAKDKNTWQSFRAPVNPIGLEQDFNFTLSDLTDADIHVGMRIDDILVIKL